MTAPDLTRPHDLKRLLARHGFAFQHRLGQHFLIDRRIVERIALTAEVDEADGVLEIGAGPGTLTQELARRAGRVVAIEIDATLLPILSESVAPWPHVQVVHADALAVDLNAVTEPWTGPWKVVANLPYYVTAPIVARVLEASVPWRRIVLMVQQEVAERMAAAPGNKVYGAFSVLVQYYGQVRLAFTVPAGAFLPAPKVGSAVLDLIPYRERPVAVAPEVFFPVVRAGFGQRRKTLLNSLTAGLSLQREAVAAALEEVGIDGNRRAETLSVADFGRLAAALARRKKQMM